MTASNVVALSRPVDSELIELLEDALSAAKAGEITAVVMLKIDPEGCAYANCGHFDRFQALGYLARLQHELHTAGSE